MPTNESIRQMLVQGGRLDAGRVWEVVDPNLVTTLLPLIHWAGTRSWLETNTVELTPSENG